MSETRPWSDLTPRERDVRVAESVMEWEIDHGDLTIPPVDEPRRVLWNEDHTGWVGRLRIPNFTIDYAASLLLEQKIEQRGLQARYVQALLGVLASSAERAASDLWYVSADDLWKIARATPDQRSEAACIAAQEP